MADTPDNTGLSDIPQAIAVRKSRWSIQLVWLIPLVAALIGGWLAAKAVLERGPTITISFKTAEGLEAGKTRIKYKEVEIGVVKSVRLSEDRTRVIATAEIVKEAENLLVEDTRFWVVRARISGASVSGLGTLLAGSYIGVDIGKSEKAQRNFVGLEVPPLFFTDVPGRQFVVHSGDIGSLDIGAPVFFRRLQVGQVTAYQLDKDGRGVTLNIFVNAPYDKYVNANTRFWHASGIDVTLDAGGVKVQTESLISILLGGIAFQTPEGSEAFAPADAKTVFELFRNRDQALKQPDLESETYLMAFDESLRGLLPGAPVDFRGIVIGEVVSFSIEINPKTKYFEMLVETRIYPGRLSALQKMQTEALDRKELLNAWVKRGLRGQLRTGNLLIGQLYIALDFFPHAPKAEIDWSKKPIQLPTLSGGLQELQTTISVLANKLTVIANKLEKVPYEQIGNDLSQTLQNANNLIQRLDTEVAPEAREVLKDAHKTLTAADRFLSADAPLLQQDTREAMREIARAAQALRVLADYLERHPEALIRGKPEDEK
ncbi:MAG: intermembrane transport protein PqiB [Burkholderiales bacterium]